MALYRATLPVLVAGLALGRRRCCCCCCPGEDGLQCSRNGHQRNCQVQGTGQVRAGSFTCVRASAARCGLGRLRPHPHAAAPRCCTLYFVNVCASVLTCRLCVCVCVWVGWGARNLPARNLPAGTKTKPSARLRWGCSTKSLLTPREVSLTSAN